MVTRVVTQLYGDSLRPSGLRVTQFSILAAIARLGEASLKQLEDALAIDQTTLTRSLSLLDRDGVTHKAAPAITEIASAHLIDRAAISDPKQRPAPTQRSMAWPSCLPGTA